LPSLLFHPNLTKKPKKPKQKKKNKPKKTPKAMHVIDKGQFFTAGISGI